MDRRQFLKSLGASAVCVSFVGCSSVISEKKNSNPKPNIVFIMADDLGYQELGCYGQKKIKTPNIDKLAAEGMKFTDFYSACAVCAPARCSLMTGKHGGHAYVRNNYEIKKGNIPYQGQLPLPADEVTVAELLKQQGYATGAFGKWGLGGVDTSGDPLNKGFDRFFGYNCQRHAHNYYPAYLIDNKKKQTLKGNSDWATGKQYAPQLIADQMLKFICENKDRPFFLYYPTVLPHLSLQAPQEDIDQYKGKWPEKPYNSKPEKPYRGRIYFPQPNPKACYAAMISFIDKQVGRLMQKLKELGLDDNTIVFFTSDNGTSFVKGQVDHEFFESVGPLRGLKGSLYEGGIRVPMIVRWPGKIKPATVTSHLAANYDVMSTLANLSNAKVPADTDGISFLPTLLSKSDQQKEHEYLFWDFSTRGQLAVRMGKWKGIKQNIKKNPNAPLELYDLENDIAEQNNIVKKHPKIAKKIETIMLKARTKPKIERFRFGKYPEDTPARS